MEHLFVLSNGGSGFYWWSASEGGGTLRERTSPAPYMELEKKKCFHRSAPGLYVFATESGRACVLVSNLYSGRYAGAAIVFDSVLLVAESDVLTPRTKRCVNAYLSGERQGFSDMGIEERRISTLDGLSDLICPSNGMIRVDWEGLVRYLDTLPEPPTESHEPVDFLVAEDTPENRARLKPLLAAVSTVPPGCLLAAVVPEVAVNTVTDEDVRWCLTNAQRTREEAGGDSDEPVIHRSRTALPVGALLREGVRAALPVGGLLRKSWLAGMGFGILVGSVAGIALYRFLRGGKR